MLDANKWHVESTSGLKEGGYTIQLLKEGSECCTDSHSVCTQAECCRLCYHMYSCAEQCYDYTNGHICKHIHRVHSIKMFSHQGSSTEIFDPVHYMNFTCSDTSFESESDDCIDPLEYAESIGNNTTGIMNNNSL